MKKLCLMFLVASVSSFAAGCAMDASTADDDPQVGAALEQAFADESFQATVTWLQGLEVEVDLLSAALHREDDGTETLRIPLSGKDYVELGYDAAAEKVIERVFTIESQKEVPEAQLAACGIYQNYDYCTFGPWLASDNEGCPGGTKYVYVHYTRRYYSNGRSLSENYRYHSCTWEAQSPSCSTTCG